MHGGQRLILKSSGFLWKTLQAETAKLFQPCLHTNRQVQGEINQTINTLLQRTKWTLKTTWVVEEHVLPQGDFQGPC